MIDTTRQQELEDIKSRVQILDLANHLGMQIRGRQARCYNSSQHKHDDRNFSLGLDINTNRYKCFTCNTGGSVIDLYMAVTGVDFKQALEALRSIAGMQSFTPYMPSKKTTNTQVHRREPAGGNTVIKNGVSISIYRMFMDLCLIDGIDEKHKQYLLGRGLTEETIDRFKLFSVHNYNAVNASLKELFTPEQLREAGLTGDKDNLIFYKHSLILPFMQGEEVYFMQGRRLDNEHPKYLLLKNISIPLYNTETLRGLNRGERVYICEGVFDAIRLEQEGKKAVAILGVNSFKPEWLDLFKGLEVILAMDNDEAGKRATGELAKTFYLKGMKVKAVDLPPEAKDITDFYLQP